MRFPIRVFKVKDQTMEPTLKIGQYVVVSGMLGDVKEGDVVMFRHPYRKANLIKRVRKIEKGKYFLVGDKNTPLGEDSREFGQIEPQDIIGKVVLGR